MNIAELGKTWEGRIVDGRLPLRQWLGGSAHSSVFLTEIAGPESPKAVVKIFPADFFDPERQLARWRAASQLNHGSLLRLLDGGRSEIDGTPFFFAVMDFVEEDLSQILPQRPLTAGEVTDLLPSVLDGLAYLHQQGFVHGHLQPSNIMASGSQLKLPLDRICTIGETRRKVDSLAPYDAPEVTHAPMSPAADVWSLGITLIAALKQHPPAYDRRQPNAPQVPDEISGPLRGIVRDCLRVEPETRCIIAEISQRLRPVPAPAPVPMIAPRETPAAPRETPGGIGHSRWRILAPIAAVVLIGAMVLGQKLLGHREEPAPAPTVEAKRPGNATHADPSIAPPAVPRTTAESPARIIHQVIPDVPASARKTIHGKVKVGVQVDVDPSGKVTSARLTSPGPSRYFANLALKTAQRWEFAAPQSNGEPMASAWTLRFQFGRASTEVFPAQDHTP